MKAKLLLAFVLPALLLCGCATQKNHAVQRNKVVIERYFDGWANRGDTAVANELIATNVVLRNPPAIVRGLEEDKSGMAKFRAAFPDLHYMIEDLIAENDRVVVRWTLRATHLGDYQGHGPSGITVTVTGVSIFRMANGKIQEITVNMDRLGMAQQLGWLPGPSPPPK